MSNASLPGTLGRALLIAPPDWGRVLRFAGTAWLLALAGIWAAQQLHTHSHETLELSPLVHLLRDTSLAVPMAALALAIGGLLTAEALDRVDGDPGSVLGRVAFALVAAIAFAVLSIPGQEVHGLLFGAEEATGSWFVDTVLDSSVVLAASIAFLLPATLLRLSPWPPDEVPAPGSGRQRSAQGAAPNSSVTAIDRLGEQGVSRHA